MHNWLSRGPWGSALFLLVVTASAQTGGSTITVHVDKPGVKVSPMFYGLMTEEINHAYDGGLYAELIRNRSFRDDATGPAFWSVQTQGGGAGRIRLDGDPVDKATILRFDVQTADDSALVSLLNDGYWGIPVKPKTTYRAAFYAKASADFTGPLQLAIESNDRKVTFASAKVGKLTEQWKRYEVTLTTGNTTPSTTNRFSITAKSAGTIWFKSISLFPPTYHGTTNGNRVDLMEKQADLRPAFLRLPGGNYLEGNTIAERFDWKATLGEPLLRTGHQGPWGYRSSDGLGLLEFLKWCEDLKVEPVLAVFAGYALRGEHIDAGPSLLPHVQDALDEIEYVTGDTKTKWGAQRAKDGHPQPFPLTYVEVGNEDWFDRSRSYDARFAQFFDAIKAKYPKLQVIATMPVKSRKPDVLDDHYYRTAGEMQRDAGHYDNYDRKGPKIFVGEWATTMGRPTPTMEAALGDAAWLTGLERNSDIVVMECYAPLFVNVNPGASQWATNLIGYDAQTSFGSPAYYVQTMFGQNTGNTVLPVELALPPAAPASVPAPHGAIGLAAYRTDAEYKDLEVSKGGNVIYRKDFATGNDGWTLGSGGWAVHEGALRLSGGRPVAQATAGDSTWTDYTYHVKARKISGNEGFMVSFHVQDSNNYWQWNIGGWGDTRSAIQRHENGGVDEVGESKDVTIDTDRWYDIRIELSGGNVKCYLDDKLITEVSETARPPIPALFASATRVDKSGEVILKVVNVTGEAMPTTLNLAGVKSVKPSAQGWVLAGNLLDINSVAEPTKVSPKELKLSSAGTTFSHTFPAHSVTVLRLSAK